MSSDKTVKPRKSRSAGASVTEGSAALQLVPKESVKKALDPDLQEVLDQESAAIREELASKGTEGELTAEELQVVFDKEHAKLQSDLEAIEGATGNGEVGTEQEGNPAGIETIDPLAGEEDNQRNREMSFARITSIEKQPKTYTVTRFFREVNAGKIIFDNALQREEGVWEEHNKGMLIHSLIYGYYIPPILFNRREDDILDTLDGKQRGTTFVRFIKDELVLAKTIPPVFGYEIAGKKFSQLPEDMRNIIMDTEIQLVIMNGLNDEEIEETFVRQNSGTQLDKFHHVSVGASAVTMGFINEVASKPFLKDYIQLSAKQRKNSEQKKIVMETIALLMNEEKAIKDGFDLQHKNVFPWVKENLRNKGVPQEIQDKINAATDYLGESLGEMEEKKRSQHLRKTHIPMLYFAALKAIEKGVSTSKFLLWVIDFLITNYDKQLSYKNANLNSVLKPNNVNARLTSMLNHFDKSTEAKA